MKSKSNNPLFTTDPQVKRRGRVYTMDHGATVVVPLSDYDEVRRMNQEANDEILEMVTRDGVIKGVRIA